jgi:ketosteroid isomerase-like protein
MEDSKLISIALRFNERINTRDLTGLGEMMTEDHVFIDIPGKVHEGQSMMVSGWFDFFKAYPDYRNNFTQIEVKDGVVVMIGFSECSHEPLDGPAIWTAKIRDGLVAEWRVYHDKEEVRKELGLV